MDMSEIKLIQGAGGGGGGSHTPVEAPNSLVTKTTARVLFLASDGEIGGLADQTNKLKSVYFNNVPVQNADGSFNFSKTQIDERYGLPSQSVMSGYPSAASSFNVGTKVTTSAPVAYTSTTSAADAIRITVRFPALFQQESNGDTNGTSVSFNIYRRLGAGSYSLVKTVTKTDKCTSPADSDYLIERPSGAGVWSVRVDRVTADNSSATKANDIYFQTATEIQFAQLPYNGRAYLGVTATAEATGSSFPTVAFDLKGLKVKVPSNYNTTTRAYTGTWDGLFKATKEVCDNPSWVLYDLLTNATHGMGSVIAESDIDQYSFYDAAVYNDGTVPALVNGVVSGTEPRYTFNYQFMERVDAWEMIQNVAASFGAAVYTSGNRVRLIQDRPTGFSRLITNSNVVDGLFEYTSSQKSSRVSACVVYWNNPAENWLSVPCYYEDATAVARYGLNTKEVVGLGITTEGQALRLAKWHVDTSVNNTDTVVFKVGFSNAGMEPGEVVKIMDTDYATVMNEAKLVASTSSTITVDRPVTVASGNTFDVVGSDGVTVETRTITSTGTVTTITFTGAALTAVAGADVIVTGAISPRLFKITNVREDSPGTYTVTAAEYDSNKFARVDSTPTGTVPVFQAPSTLPSQPLSLAFRESAINDNNSIRRSLMISWSRPAVGVVRGYLLRYRRNSTTWEEKELNVTSYEVAPAADGTYEAQVYAIGYTGIESTAATGSYTISLTGGGLSPLGAPTSLQVIGGGTAFNGQDINFQWTNPSSNSTVANVTLRDFEVRFIETSGSTTVRTSYISPVNPGGSQTASYTYAMNTADGGPRRTVQVQVRCRDTNNNLSNPVTATFTNAAPAAVTATVTAGFGTTFVKLTRPTDPDFTGFLLWGSTTSGFTPSAGNLIYEGDSSSFTHAGLADATTWYYKAAAYDAFAKDYAGSGLNLSAQVSGTTVSAPGISKGASTPGSGTEGDLFFNTTDGKLYRYHSGAWTTAVPTVDLTGTISSGQIAANAITLTKFASGLTPVEVVASLPSSGNFQGRTVVLTTDNKLYRYNGSAWVSTVPSTDITGTLSDAQIAAISAAKVTGTLSDSQLAAISAAKVTGQITSTQITDNSISTAKLQAGSVTTNEIAANTITAADIAAGTITATQIAAGTITGSNIAAGTISASNIAADTITAAQIAANAITSNELAANSVVAGKVAAGAITATEIAAGAITTNKLFVQGRGKALNDDPACSDATAWSVLSGSITIQTDSSSPVGTTSMRCTNATQVVSRSYPIEAGKTYKISLYAKQVSGGGVLYIRQYGWNSVGTLISYVVTALQPAIGTLEAIAVPSSWIRYSGYITPAATAVNGAVYLHVNWNTVGVTDLCDIRAEEYIGADLIVDGSITATKIAANTITASQIASDTITAGQIAANAITSSELAANSVVAGKVAAATIGASEIIAGSITGDRLVANTITSSQIASNTITASQIAAGTITSTQIAAGTIDASRMNVSSLSAISATIGTLRTATSGARMEIADNVLRVYDTSGVLRVKIGNLA